MSKEKNTPEVTITKTSRRGRPSHPIGFIKENPVTGVAQIKTEDGWKYIKVSERASYGLSVKADEVEQPETAPQEAEAEQA